MSDSPNSGILICNCCCSCCCLVFAPLPEPFLVIEAFEADEVVEDDDEVEDVEGLFGTGVDRTFLLLNKTAVLRLTPAGEGVCKAPPLPTLSFESDRPDRSGELGMVLF